MKEKGARFGGLAIVSIALWSAGAVAAQAPERGHGSITVQGPVRVIEGDTLELNIDGRRFGVKIIGIKAPEGNTACGREAIAATEQLVAEGIFLDEDLALPSFDGRLLRLYQLRTAAGVPLAAELARAGLARTEPSHKGARDLPDVAAAEADARAARRGCVWSEEPIR